MARDVSSPMSTTSTIPQRCGPEPRSIPGFSAWNVTVRTAVEHAAAARAIPGIEAARDVHRQHPRPLDVRSVPPGPGAKAGAVRRVDHEISSGKHRWTCRHVVHPDAATAGSEPFGGDPAVGAVVARARHHIDGSPVGAPEQLQRGAADRSTGAVDQDIGRLRGGRVDGAHLLDGDDRDHGPNLRGCDEGVSG